METSPNSREGIEEIVTKMLAIGWDSKMKKHDGTSIVVSFTKAELCELLLNLQEQHHQELQKAREEERERSANIVEQYMEDNEYWQPIAGAILNKIVTRKKAYSELNQDISK